MLIRLKQLPYMLECAASIWLIFYVLMKFKTVEMTLSQYGVNANIFFFLDICTIPPYIFGTSKVIRRSIHKKFDLITSFWIVFTFCSFLLPYIYLFLIGKDQFPPIVLIYLIFLILIIILISLSQLILKYQNQ